MTTARLLLLNYWSCHWTCQSSHLICEINTGIDNLRLQPFSFRLRKISIYMDMVNTNCLNCLYLIYERPLLKNCKYVPKPLTYAQLSLKRPSWSHCLAHIASITVATLSEPQRSVQRCLDFKKSLSTETLTPGMAKKSQAMWEIIRKSYSWSCQTSNE